MAVTFEQLSSYRYGGPEGKTILCRMGLFSTSVSASTFTAKELGFSKLLEVNSLAHTEDDDSVHAFLVDNIGEGRLRTYHAEDVNVGTPASPVTDYKYYLVLKGYA